MKRRLILIFPFTCVLLLLAAGGLQAGWETFKLRPVNGRLDSTLPSMTLTSGPFQLAWDGDRRQLTIYPADSPQKIVWSSSAGLPFVAAGRGKEVVTETRGSFKIEENREVTCAQQQIDAITANGGVVRVQGTLGCDDNRDPVAFSLSFAAAGDDQLVFELATDAADLNRTYLT